MRLIDADALKSVPIPIGYIGEKMVGAVQTAAIGAVLKAIDKTIDDAPTIDAAPVVRGEWVNKPKTCVFICSMCGREVKTFHTNDIKVVNDEYPFCHCGAKMDGERRESEAKA